MKLNPNCAVRTAELLNAATLAEANPSVSALSKRFGEHTFFLDLEGLFIVEDAGDGEVELGRVVKLAHWTDLDRTVLETQEPERTELVVALSDAA